MQLNSTLAWLVDEAAQTATPELFLAGLGGRLIEDGEPLAGGALTLASPHPLIARRALLWRAGSGEVIEALGFVAGAMAAGSAGEPGESGRRWLAGLAAGPVHEDAIGPAADGPRLGWVGPRSFTPEEAGRLSETARFAMAPLAALGARATLTVALEAYLGRRSACDAALKAVAAARSGMAHLDAARRRDGLEPLPFGVALHLGEMLWGNIGAADRLDFTAIGPAVNLVSRLQDLCRPLDRAVLVSGAFAAETNAPLIPLGGHALRGVAACCAVFTVGD